MTDIAERLNKIVAEYWLREDISDLLMDAADEIRRLHAENAELRGIIQQAADDVVAASYPRKMHLEWLEAARKVLAEDD